MEKISIVIPVYNERENVEKLYSEIVDVCKISNYVFEIIFVDDGSTDGTYDIIKNLKNVVCICMRKN
ncbi:MAG: glycosyltransferase, partial [Spirochaetia bacterium]|nr:glycosyltransferase [Spirochaetia bacterium]